MKLIWRYIKIIIFIGAPLLLSGCAQVETARQWWEVWRNPISTSAPAALSSSKVTVNLVKVASQHPAWKLAQALETSPSTDLQLNWTQPDTQINSNLVHSENTFAGSNFDLSTIDFTENEKLITASNMRPLNAQIMQDEQAAWKKWEENINGNLQADRQQVSQAMQVDLNDQIEQTQKNIPEIGAPLTPSTKIQNEMINLRLKLLNNISLSPDDKAATQNRLDQLNSQWSEQLRQQAQQGADNQKYWRETVPRQMRQTGEENMQQVLEALKLQDQKAIDLTLNKQQEWLEQDNSQNIVYSLTSPRTISAASRAKSTFHAPVLSVKSSDANSVSIYIPAIKNTKRATASELEVRQLKQVALEAAKRAVQQSTVLHGWHVVSLNAKASAALPDVTNKVLQEANF